MAGYAVGIDVQPLEDDLVERAAEAGACVGVEALWVAQGRERQRHAVDGEQQVVIGNLALARIRQRKLDEAAAALHSAIDMVEMTWGGGGLNIVFGAGRELRPWRQVPIVQDVYDRLLTLMTAA